MKKEEKKYILILIVVVIIILAVIFFATRKNNKNEEVPQDSTIENEVVEDKYVSVLSDGTKINTSEKIKESKIIDELKLDSLQISEKDGVTTILGTITNDTNQTRGDFSVNVKLVDKEGNEITTITGYIRLLNPGESTQFNCASNAKYVNAYNFELTKK